MSVCLYIGMSVCLYVSMSVCLYVCMSVSLFVCVSVYRYVCLSVRWYVCMSVCMHACMYVCNYPQCPTYVPKIAERREQMESEVNKYCNAMRRTKVTENKDIFIQPAICSDSMVSLCSMFVSMYA